MSKRSRREGGPVLRFRARVICQTCQIPHHAPWRIGLDAESVMQQAQADLHSTPEHPNTILSGWQSHCRQCLHWRSPLCADRRDALRALTAHEQSEEHRTYVPPRSERQEAERQTIGERIAGLIENS